ncbi:MAG: alpha/beta fold hydrolase [Ilumatobacteraceae bacterium]
MRRTIALLFTVALVAACSSGDDAGSAASVPTGSETPVSSAATTQAAATDVPATDVPATDVPATDGAAPTSTVQPTTVAPTTTIDLTSGRPFDVFAPSSYDPATPMPLVVLLHGFGASGAIQEAYFQLQPLAESRGFLYVHPDGTVNQLGKQFWNATDACCGFLSDVDDSAYLMALIHKVQADYNVDPQRIYLVGHSNGGFMSYRMACEHADTIAAIVSLAGATFGDAAACKPSEPVSVLQIHGTEDHTIPYDGGTILGHNHPGAEETVADWAAYNGCTGPSADSPTTLDLEGNIAGAESTVSEYTGCPTGIAVDLWTIPGGAHIPGRSDSFGAQVIDFLFAHPKP